MRPTRAEPLKSAAITAQQLVDFLVGHEFDVAAPAEQECHPNAYALPALGAGIAQQASVCEIGLRFLALNRCRPLPGRPRPSDPSNVQNREVSHAALSSE